MNKNFDIVMYTNHGGLGTNCTDHAHRLPFIKGIARAMEGTGKILVVLRYRSIPQCWFEKKNTQSGERGLQQLAENLWSMQPVVFGNLVVTMYLPLLRWILRKQITWQIKQAIKSLDIINCRVSWMTHPYHYFYRRCAEEAVLIYECYDDYLLDSSGKYDKRAELMEIQVAQNADLNITTATTLFEKIAAVNKNTRLISNGVIYDLFSQSRDSSVQVAPEIEWITHPIIGMIGALNLGYDYELLKEIIRKKPGWSFVFIGSVADNAKREVDRLAQYPNFHLFSWRPYEELPKFLKGFDAAIIPYKVNDWTNSINPNKLYDYFAAGIPVIATPIIELQRYNDCVFLCKTGDECIRAFELLFKYGAEDKRSRAIQIAKGLSWTSITRNVIGEIKLLVKAKRGIGKLNEPKIENENNLIKILRFIAGVLLWYSGAAVAFRFVSNRLYGNAAVILCIHKVKNRLDEKSNLSKLYLKGEALELKYLEKRLVYLKKKFNIISLEKYIDICNEKKGLPRNSCILTFDDGDLEHYTIAYELLKKLELPATFFIPTDYISNNAHRWEDRISAFISAAKVKKFELNTFLLSRKNFNIGTLGQKNKVVNFLCKTLKYVPMKTRDDFIEDLAKDLRLYDDSISLDYQNHMEWNHLKTISDNPIMSIGVHTQTHQVLTMLSEREIEDEIKGSKRIIEENIGRTVTLFSYPFGKSDDLNEEIKKMVEKLGFRAACGFCYGRNNIKSDKFALKRIPLLPEPFIVFKARMSGIFDLISTAKGSQKSRR